MYLGRIVEVGPADAVLAEPAHPYTRALIESIPQVAAGQADESERLGGEIPSAVAPPAGCAFHPRCPLAFDRCPTELPPLLEAAPGRLAACHLVQGGSA
jgi:peptide/nickel transport system ATP-binding protein